MGNVACGTTLQLERGVLVDERTLLICVTLHARLIGTDSQLSLFALKAAMRVMTIAASHGSFEHLVVVWLLKL
jgi:hypothetical protein